jgi:CDP-diacylglycerol--glycerol-3-phosphate 3-phosphatidyltransferase
MAERRSDLSVHPVFRVGPSLSATLCLTAVLYLLFSTDGAIERTLQPALVAGLCWTAQLLYVNYTARESPAGEVVPSGGLGLATSLTLLRGALYACVAGFAVVPPETGLAWVPASCYGLGVLLDKLDGTVARTVGRQTPLGERIDVAFDTFGFVAAPLVAVLWGQLPVWYLSLSAARYVYLGGLCWRRMRGRRVYDRPDSDLGRYLAGVQMVFLTLALLPAAPTDAVRAVSPFVLAPSLTVFGRDFLVASGRLG